MSVTSRPWRARNSATPSPLWCPSSSTTTAAPSGNGSPERTSVAVSAPSAGRAGGSEPVATTTRSGRSATTSSVEAGPPPRRTSTPSRTSSRARHSIAGRYSSRPGSRASIRTWPPRCCSRSKSVTLSPSSAAWRAASRPATPPPTTTTRRPPPRVGAEASNPAAGFWRHAIGNLRMRRAMQRLAPMHGLMVAAAPRAALAGIVGSAISARVIPTRSQAPSASARSARSGWLIRPSAMIAGPEVRALTGAAHAIPMPGSVPIGGIRRCGAS